jgi:hypothetical protein
MDRVVFLTQLIEPMQNQLDHTPCPHDGHWIDKRQYVAFHRMGGQTTPRFSKAQKHQKARAPRLPNQ